MAARPRIRHAEIQLGEQQRGFTLVCMPRRRHVHVLVNERGGLEVRAPWRYSLDDAKRAISENGVWVQDQIARHSVLKQRRHQWVTGCTLPLLDERLQLRVENVAQQHLFDSASRRGSGQVYRRGQCLWVELYTIQGCNQVSELLHGWYRRQAQDILPVRMQPIARELNVQHGRVSIRAQRTRWGSCSPDGNISLNWRLLLLPEAVCDYVLAHELCHLKEMNHSPRFWSLVARVIPEVQIRRRELRRLGQSLTL